MDSPIWITNQHGERFHKSRFFPHRCNGFLDVIQSGLDGAEAVAFAVGIVVSALSGVAAIWFLLRYLQRSNTAVFVLYRLGLGLFILGLLATGLK